MAQVKQVGVGRKTTGTIDGITYYVLNGKTFARSTPTMPVSVYTSTEARIRQAVFKFVQQHMKLHLRTIRQTITAKTGTPCNRYYSLNKKGLNAALQTLAEQYVDGLDVTITDIEAAISAYAAEHPTAIKIASKSGYAEVYLTGPWPETITLNALSGDSTVIIIVSENGVQTTINADGTVTTETYSGSGSTVNGSGSNSGGSSTPSTGSGTGSETTTVAAPTFSGETQFSESTQVTMSGPAGASIFYTVDGSTPTDQSLEYEEPITLTATTTVKAIAIKDGVSSSVTSRTYSKVDAGGGDDEPGGSDH